MPRRYGWRSWLPPPEVPRRNSTPRSRSAAITRSRSASSGCAQDQREGVVAAALGREVGLVRRRVEVAQEQRAGCSRAALVVGVEALQLRAADDGVDLGAAHVVGRAGEDEVGVQVGVRVARSARLQPRRIRLRAPCRASAACAASRRGRRRRCRPCRLRSCSGGGRSRTRSSTPGRSVPSLRPSKVAPCDSQTSSISGMPRALQLVEQRVGRARCSPARA